MLKAVHIGEPTRNMGLVFSTNLLARRLISKELKSQARPSESWVFQIQGKAWEEAVTGHADTLGGLYSSLTKWLNVALRSLAYALEHPPI